MARSTGTKADIFTQSKSTPLPGSVSISLGAMSQTLVFLHMRGACNFQFGQDRKAEGEEFISFTKESTVHLQLHFVKVARQGSIGLGRGRREKHTHSVREQERNKIEIQKCSDISYRTQILSDPGLPHDLF